MASILKNFTPEQLYELMKNKVISDNVGLTNFNQGSDIRSILEAVGLATSTVGFDFLEAIRQSIPIALYDGLNYTRKSASIATGFLRFYRLPIFYITYTGADSSVEITIDAVDLTLATSSTPADDVVFDFATYSTIDLLVAGIEAHGSYSATKVQNGAVADLYNYSTVEFKGVSNYLGTNNTRDITVDTAGLINIPSGVQASTGELVYQTTASGTIPAGDATSADIASESLQLGTDNNILANTIHTLNGDGYLVTSITGVEHVINDSAFSNGTEAESDDERAERFQTTVQGLHGGTVKGIEADVLAIDQIKSVTLRERDPVPGTNTIIADDGTGNLSTALIDTIRTLIDGDPDDLANTPGSGVAGITYNIQAPTVVPVDVTATITRVGTISDSTELQTAVQSAIEQYINTRRLGEDVVLSEIIKRAKAAHPAVYDFTISVPASNTSISTAQISRTGAGTGALVTLILTTLTSMP